MEKRPSDDNAKENNTTVAFAGSNNDSRQLSSKFNAAQPAVQWNVAAYNEGLEQLLLCSSCSATLSFLAPVVPSTAKPPIHHSFLSPC